MDLQLREMSSFLEAKFEDTFTEEQKVIRAPGVRDTHIHCVFLILDPMRLDANISASRKQGANKFSTGGALRLVGGLDEDLDLQVMRTLQGKSMVIPVISKADTITTAHMAFLKRTVYASLKQAKLDPLEALNLSGDSEEEDDGDEFDERDEDRYNDSGDEGEGVRRNKNRDTANTVDVINNLVDSDDSDYDNNNPGAHSSPVAKASQSTPATSPPRGQRGRAASAMGQLADNELPYLPMSILSPDIFDLEMSGDNSPPGRRFPWGFADPYNVDHCDFVRLKDSVFSEWRAELREASRERWYEGWRTSRLKRNTGPGGRVGTAGGRPSTMNTQGGASVAPGMRSPNGRPSGNYGNSGQVPGQALGGPPQGKAPSSSGGVYRGAGQYQ